MTQLGQAFYCDDCGAEITPGSTRCSSCDPEYGAVQLTYTLIITIPDEEPSTPAQQESKSWWKLW